MKAIIYTRQKFCPFCEKAKTLLSIKGIEYKEIVIDGDEAKEKMFKHIGQEVRTVPQIFLDIDGKEMYIGGYDSLEVHFAGSVES